MSTRNRCSTVPPLMRLRACLFVCVFAFTSLSLLLLTQLTLVTCWSLLAPRSYRFFAEMFAVHKLSLMRRQLLALARKMLRLSLHGSIMRWTRAQYAE